MFEPGVPVVERDSAIERLIELNLGASEAVAAGLRTNLQPAPFPLHHVVVADDALVKERADALEISRSGAPSVNRVARSTGEAAVIVGDKAAQHGIGGIEIASTGQAQFTALQHAPKALAPQ